MPPGKMIWILSAAGGGGNQEGASVPSLSFPGTEDGGSPVGCLLLWEVFAGRGAVGAASAAGLWKIRRDGDDLRENACIGRAGKV